MIITKTYGRKVLYANVDEVSLLSMSEEEQEKTITDILANVIPIHNQNKLECEYLIDYKNGIQDIFTDKVKHTRKEIDNHTVENWAYALIDFKKCFLLSKPIQYTLADDGSSKEISTLNKYCQYEGKKAKDMEIYEDVLTCGRGFRYTNSDKVLSDDEAPFELINLDVQHTEVVYSSGIRKEQLFAFIETPMMYKETIQDIKTGELQEVIRDYMEYQIYLRNRTFTVTNRAGGYTVVPNTSKALILNKHIIQEYFINKARISLIEIGKDLFNDINYLDSLDKDDMEQFVNAIMVFTNAEVNSQDLEEIKELGAVSISSTENKQASVTLLEQRLKASDTQVYYTRLLTALHQILGIPMASDNGTVTSGDTGQAKLTGQGYTMAGIRIEGDETMFDTCDRKTLDVILKICKENPSSEIKNLKMSEVESKYSRDTSDNLLVKTQGLMNLYACDIPREVANSVVNLFNDANAVTNMQQKMFGDQVSQQNTSKQEDTINNNDKTNAQNNDIKKTTQNQVQSK